METKTKRVIFETIFLYGLIGWLYVVLIQITHPSWIYNPLAWWFPLRVDYFGEICFVISIVGFVFMRWLKD